MGKPATPLRRLAKALGTFHNISYYAPEMRAFSELGLPEYWRAYMAYRAAPMGAVPASAATSVFYNFAPRRVGEGLPSAWESTDPSKVLELRDRCIEQALSRALPAVGPEAAAQINRVADLALDAIGAVEAGARPLFAAHRSLDTPDTPLMRLWFAATLWREHRGDGHNIALAAAEIDGIECHVLLAAKGVGSRDVITKIRGWTGAEWDDALARLIDRQLLNGDGTFTETGAELRRAIESHTDELARPPQALLGEDPTEQLLDVVEPLVDQLISSSAVAGRWPPPKPVG